MSLFHREQVQLRQASSNDDQVRDKHIHVAGLLLHFALIAPGPSAYMKWY